MTDDSERERILEQMRVLRAQTGDRSAFNQLFNSYDGKLLYYLRRLLDDRAQAEDVLQEVWLLVFRRIGSLKQPAAFRTWLYRIARNQAITRLKKTSRIVSLDSTDEAKVVQPNEPSEESLTKRFDARTLHQAIGNLTPSLREVLTLRFMEQLSYDEMATIVGCSIGTIRSRLHYAKKSLKEILVEGEERTNHDKR